MATPDIAMAKPDIAMATRARWRHTPPPAVVGASGGPPPPPKQPYSDTSATFARATRDTDDAAARIEPEPEPEPEPGPEMQPGGVRRCCARLRPPPTRVMLALAAVAQLAATAASVFQISPAWPERSRLLSASTVALGATWLAAVIESRTLAAACFVALCWASGSLFLFWSSAGGGHALCEHADAVSPCGSASSCCYRCLGIEAAAAAVAGDGTGGADVVAWRQRCALRMLQEGHACWYPHWCGSANSALLLGKIAALTAIAAASVCWRRWAQLAPRTKAETVASRGRSFVGRSMVSFIGKSMSRMPSFLFKPQKVGGKIQQPKPSGPAAAAAAEQRQSVAQRGQGHEPATWASASAQAGTSTTLHAEEHEAAMLARADRLLAAQAEAAAATAAAAAAAAAAATAHVEQEAPSDGHKGRKKKHHKKSGRHSKGEKIADKVKHRRRKKKAGC
jgi:hypothetical protein